MDSNDIQEDKDSGPESQINLPEPVMKRIEELMGGTDDFDSADFDAVSYINKLFPTEQSLAGVEAATARCSYSLAAARSESRGLLRAQAKQREAGQKALLEAQGLYAELAQQIAEITVKASRSESMVRSITGEMKQLDRAKCNLTAAIACLTHYRLLLSGRTALRQHAASRDYRAARVTLQAILQVLEHFSSYSAIPELSALQEDVSSIRDQLASQIIDDFKQTLTAGGTPVPHKTLMEACGVVDVLQPQVKEELVSWLVASQLQEYRLLFSDDQENSWLPGVGSRFAWLKRSLLALEASLASVVPPEWALSEAVAHEFCRLTRASLCALMSSRAQELDVNTLLSAIHKTQAFEALLHKRFTGLEPNETEVSTDADNNNAENGPVWLGAISSCFEPHLSLYIASVDASLADMPLDAEESSNDRVGRSQLSPLSSCAQLLGAYKTALLHCTRLSRGKPLHELSVVFGVHLRAYCSRLHSQLPKTTQSRPALVANLLLREENAPRYTDEDRRKICEVLITAEYCLESTHHLELKIKERIHPQWKDKVDFSAEQSAFSTLLSDCVQLLVRGMESRLEPLLQTIPKLSWNQRAPVGDRSPYVQSIQTVLTEVVPPLRDDLSASRKYFTHVCIKFSSDFVSKLVQNIYKCRNLTSVGAEQLLLDAHVLKTTLLELPSLGSEVKRPAPAVYTKPLLKQMSRAEMILKLAMAPLDVDNLGSFVGQFCRLLPDAPPMEFQRLMDMKGVKLPKGHAQALDDLFRKYAHSHEDTK